MSQFFVGINGQNIPPTVPIMFDVTPDAPAVTPGGGPAEATSNVIYFNATSTTANDNNGITVGAAGNVVTYMISNRILGSATTSGTTPSTLWTFPLGSTPGTYLLQSATTAYDSTDSLAGGWSFTYVVRTDASQNGHLITSGNYFTSEEGAMSGVVVSTTINISGNSITLSVTGLSGKTINWNNITTYVFVA